MSGPAFKVPSLRAHEEQDQLFRLLRHIDLTPEATQRVMAANSWLGSKGFEA